MKQRIVFSLAALLGVLELANAAQAQQVIKKAPPAPVAVPQKKQFFTEVPTSHQQIASVDVKSTDGKHKIQTLSIDAEGRVLALVAPPKAFGAPVKDASGEVHIFSPEGKALATIKLDFHANSVAGGPDGNIYVAGEGKIAKFSRDGKQLATIPLPHIALIDAVALRKEAEQRLKAQHDSMQKIIKAYKERVKVLEAKKAEDRVPLEKRQLEQYVLLLKNYEANLAKGDESAKLEQIIGQITARLRTINGLTFSAKDVFVACGDTKGYGYSVWRMDHNFQNATQVLAGLGGCCGQMDVQASGTDLLVAENTKHCFSRYDRNGKFLSAMGERGSETEVDCFGGCCNPMNLCPASKGDIFTAESEGYLKRFSAKGKFLGLVARVPLTGAGCKNVAFAVSSDEQRIYFLDLLGSRFLILAKK